MKKIEDLTFTDDYMFGAVMHDPEICKKIIERILKINVDHVEYPELQKEIRPYYESKGVRLDVYVKDSDKIFDIEMQSSECINIAKRTRYYQSMLDCDFLAKGETYDELPESYIVFFCKKDWLGTGLSVAKFKNICVQDKELELNDGCVKYFLNADMWEKESDIEIKSFLKYLYDYEATDELTQEIDNKVFSTKINEIFRNGYLSMNLHDQDLIRKAKSEGKAEGLEEGRTEGQNLKAVEAAKNLLKENISPEIIAKCENLPLEKVLELKRELN